MRRSYLYITGTLILTGVLIIYNQLGGFNEPEISLKAINKYQIAGKMYEGNIRDREWEELYVRIRSFKEKQGLQNSLAIIWYNSPEDEKGVVKAFVGLIWNDSIAVPEGFDIKDIVMQGLIRAELKGHALVMPSPKKIIKKIHLFAETKGLTLKNIIIDRYPEESIIYTEIPIEEGFLNEVR